MDIIRSSKLDYGKKNTDDFSRWPVVGKQPSTGRIVSFYSKNKMKLYKQKKIFRIRRLLSRVAYWEQILNIQHEDKQECLITTDSSRCIDEKRW